MTQQEENVARETSANGENASAQNSVVQEPASEFAKHESAIHLPGKPAARRPAHYGLDIQFEDHADDAKLGRLVESTVWVNRAHPAYCRALASRSIGYHIALAVAMSLAPLAVEPQKESEFLLTFLIRWGEAIEKPGLPKRTGAR
jgi:hypothetical protein